MSTVMFTPRGDGYAGRFAFNREIIDVVKLAVPSTYRRWDPTRKQWSVDRGWARPLADALRRSGHTVIGLEPADTNGDGDAADWARGVFKGVGPGRTDIVYRMLRRALHPDTGGDHRLMQELNVARDELNDKKGPR
jgi:hypothetical protein